MTAAGADLVTAREQSSVGKDWMDVRRQSREDGSLGSEEERHRLERDSRLRQTSGRWDTCKQVDMYRDEGQQRS